MIVGVDLTTLTHAVLLSYAAGVLTPLVFSLYLKLRRWRKTA